MSLIPHLDSSSAAEKDISPESALSEVYDTKTGVVSGARSRFTYDDATRLKRKADWHILPILIAAYLVKNMDGNAPSYARTMNAGTTTNVLTMLNMTSNQWGYLSTIFTVTFVIFEIPSNMIIKWSTPRLHFVRIMLIWSAVCACHAACTNKTGLYVCRALLGAAEAGLYPGILYYLTCWYRPDEIATRMAMLGTLGQFSGIINALLAYGLSFVSGKGMAGWQWLFVINGLIGFIVVGVTYTWLPDWPDSPPSYRQFLSQAEGAFMTARLPPNASRSGDKHLDWQVIKQELKSPLLYGFTGVQFFLNAGASGVNFWLPTIIAGFGLTSPTTSLLLNIPPAALFCIVAVGFASFLDRDTRVPRPLILILSASAIIATFIGLIFCQNKAGLYALILICYIPYAIYASSFMPLRAQTTQGSTSSAFVYAFQNGISQAPGLFTAQIFQSRYAPRYTVSFIVCIIFFVAAAASSAFVWWKAFDVERDTRRVARLRRQAGKETGEVIDEEVSEHYIESSRGVTDRLSKTGRL